VNRTDLDREGEGWAEEEVVFLRVFFKLGFDIAEEKSSARAGVLGLVMLAAVVMGKPRSWEVRSVYWERSRRVWSERVLWELGGQG
jgi:hypothetical protein